MMADHPREGDNVAIDASSKSHQKLSRDVIRRFDEEQRLVDSQPLDLNSQQNGACFGKRHLMAFMGFLGLANVYAMRVNLSVAIVAMVNSTAIPHVNQSVNEVCENLETNDTKPTRDGEFVWDEYDQGIILGAFFYGYMITNIPGGLLGERFGGKVVFGLGVLVTSVFTILTPVVAKANKMPLLIALRVVEGLGEGVTFPAMNCLMAQWIPPLERSKLGAFIYAGSQLGTVISMPISGILCQSTFLGGWPSVFYVFGVCGLVWFVLWMYLISSSPATHPTISMEEKIYIQTTLSRAENCKKFSPPWRRILTSMPFWAILVVHVSQTWGFYFILTELPTYMKNILHFSISNDSMYSAIPYLACWIFSLIVGQAADKLRTSGTLSTTATRRVFTAIGIYGPMVCLILVGYMGCNKEAAIGLLSTGIGLNGACYSGFGISHLDISPNFAGTLLGMTNTVATVPGFVAPMVVGKMINGEETVPRWQLVFWIAGIVYFVGCTFYLIFSSGEQQPWNDIEGTQGNAKRKGFEAGHGGPYGSTSAHQQVNPTTNEASRQLADIPEVF